MKHLLIWLCCATAVSGGLRHKKTQPPQPVPTTLDQYIQESLQHAELTTHTPGSLWTPESRLAALGMDLRASQVSDLVTILVAENASAVAKGDVKTARSSAAKSSVTALAGVPKAAATLPNLLNAKTDTSLDGTGTTSRASTVSTTLSARVVQVLPNGNLVVEGSKNVVVNSENQMVTVRGVVRPIDLNTGNIVRSERLAYLDVRINGKGVVNDSIRRPFFLYRLLLGLLPF